MNIATVVKQLYELEGEECKGVHVYANDSDWQNTLELSTRFFPKTFNERKDVILTITDDGKERERYVISCQLSYNQDTIPARIGLAIPSIEDETRQKDLERTVQNSKRLILKVEERN